MESSATLGADSWTAVAEPPALIGDDLVVTNEMSGPRQFYRLHRR